MARKILGYQPSCEPVNYGSLNRELLSVPVDDIVKQVYSPDEDGRLPSDVDILINMARNKDKQHLIPVIQGKLMQKIQNVTRGVDIDSAFDLCQGKFESVNDYLDRLSGLSSSLKNVVDPSGSDNKPPVVSSSSELPTMFK